MTGRKARKSNGEKSEKSGEGKSDLKGLTAKPEPEKIQIHFKGGGRSWIVHK